MTTTPTATAPVSRRISELFGRAVGAMVAPLFAVVSFARSARTFHPRGSTLHAVVRRHPGAAPELHELANRLTGYGIVRFSSALWKRAERVPDVLGCAIRFRSDPREEPEPAVGDQDLLLATIRRPWTMSLAPLTTHLEDYLYNDFFGVSPFDVGLTRPMYFRLHPQGVAEPVSGKRVERLAREVDQQARLDLECSAKPFGPWQPILELRLERPAELDGDALRFSAFRSGRGLRPRGFIHAMRKPVYDASQAGRAAATRPEMQTRRAASTPQSKRSTAS